MAGFNASRRRLVVGGIGALGAYVLSAVGRPRSVLATDPNDVVNGQDNAPVQHRTLVHNNHAGVSNSSEDENVDALFGWSENNGAGVAGQSTGTGVGVKGYCGPIPMPDTLFTGYGVYGNGPLAGVYGTASGSQGPGVHGVVSIGTAVLGESFGTVADQTGVRGVGASNGVIGQASSEGFTPPPVSHVGVFGWAHESGDNAAAATGVRGQSDSGIGVHANATGTAIALKVDGKAHFSRSGTATVAVNKGAVTVSLAGVTPASMVFAVVAKNVSGRFIRAAVPGNGSFVIYLNKAVAASTPISWFVLD